MLLHVIALVLFIINAAVHASQWYAIHPDRGWGIALSLIGVLCTVGAGFFGWTLIRTDHVGVELGRDETRQSVVGRRGVS